MEGRERERKILFERKRRECEGRGEEVGGWKGRVGKRERPDKRQGI